MTRLSADPLVTSSFFPFLNEECFGKSTHGVCDMILTQSHRALFGLCVLTQVSKLTCGQFLYSFMR